MLISHHRESDFSAPGIAQSTSSRGNSQKGIPQRESPRGNPPECLPPRLRFTAAVTCTCQLLCRVWAGAAGARSLPPGRCPPSSLERGRREAAPPTGGRAGTIESGTRGRRGQPVGSRKQRSLSIRRKGLFIYSCNSHRLSRSSDFTSTLGGSQQGSFNYLSLNRLLKCS